MSILTISHLEAFLTGELFQSLELIITFVSLYGIIFFLLMTGENRKNFRKQK